VPSPLKNFPFLVSKYRLLVHSGLLFLQLSGPFCTQIMLIDDRPYTTFPSGPKNEETVDSSCLNVGMALVLTARVHGP